MNEPARLNIREWTVSELSAALRKTVEDAFGYVRVRGEISGYRGAHSSGHCYFALKDDSAKIEAVVWKTAYARMRIKPEEGLEVIVTGRLTTYPGQSKYQIVVEMLAPAGVGALMALLEERKKRLAGEGLFDAARKRRLPYLPEAIGGITSPTGAVIRDILHRLADRFARHVLVWPVRVQGDGAAEEVVAAIQGFNAFLPGDLIRKPDLIIVARGGGSIEDLWSFNEENVARAAAARTIPLISAVEIPVPVRAELLLRLTGLARRSLACWQRCQEGRRTELRAAARALPGVEQLLALPRQRLDSAGARLPRALIANAQSHHAQFSRIAGRLGPHVLRTRITRCCEVLSALMERGRRADGIARARRAERLRNATTRLAVGLRANADAHRARIIRVRERVTSLAERGERAIRLLLTQRAASLEHCGQLLHALSQRGVLARGFALIRDLKRRPVRKAAAIAAGMAVDIEFYDGYVRATAEQSFTTVEKPQPTTKNRGRRDPGQGSLFG